MSAVTRLMGMVGSDPKDVMVDWAANYKLLEDHVTRLDGENADLRSTNERLIQENCMLREGLEREKRSKDALQAYAVSMTTRLETIVDIVDAAKRDAEANAAFAGRRTSGPPAASGGPSPVRGASPTMSGQGGSISLAQDGGLRIDTPPRALVLDREGFLDTDPHGGGGDAHSGAYADAPVLANPPTSDVLPHPVL